MVGYSKSMVPAAVCCLLFCVCTGPLQAEETPIQLQDEYQPGEPAGLVQFEDPFILKFKSAESDGTEESAHYVRFKIAFSVSSPRIAEQIMADKAAMAITADTIIMYFTEKTAEDFNTSTWSERKHELLKNCNSRLPEDFHFEAVYFTEFLIQEK